MPKKKTHEEFLLEMEKANPDIKVIGRYGGIRVRIEVACKNCGRIYSANPENLLIGQKCKACVNKQNGIKKRKTHEQFVREVEQIGGLEVKGVYETSSKKIKILCTKHNIEFNIAPSNLLYGRTGCECCEKEKIDVISDRLRKPQEHFIKQLKLINPDIEVIGEYKNNKTPIACKCKICGEVNTPSPVNLLRGQGGCKTCGLNKRGLESRLTQEVFKERVNEVSPYIEVLGEYETSKDKILVRCKNDNNRWSAKAQHLLDGHGCPMCKSSEGEKIIAEYLRNNFIPFKTQYKFDGCKFKRRLPFDFYIPSLKTAIEYDGIQHFEPIGYFGGIKHLEGVQLRDKIKNEFCKNNNIHLIRIPYTEKDVHKVIDECLSNRIKNFQLELII